MGDELQEIQEIWKTNRFEKSGSQIHSRVPNIQRSLWIQRDFEGRLTALSRVAESWNETRTQEVFLVRIGPDGIMPMEYIPGAEVTQWTAGRKVLK